MKRLASAMVALVIILCVGSVFAGAEDTTASDISGEETVENVDIVLSFSLKSDSLSVEEAQAKLKVPSLKVGYETSTAKVTVGTHVDTYPISCENNKGVVNCTIPIPSYTTTVSIEVELISATFDSDDIKGLNIFENASQNFNVSLGDTGRTYVIKHDWSRAIVRFYESDDFRQQIAILLEEGGTLEGSQNMIDEFMGDITDYLSRFSLTSNLFMSDEAFGSDELNGIISRTFNIIYPTAFLMMCIMWLISIGKSSVSMDLWQKESYIKPLLRLVWGVGMLSLGLPLLELIFTIFHRLSMEAWGSGIGNGFNSLFDTLVEESKEWVDDSWIVGGIITFINLLLNIPKILIFALFEMIFGIVFYIVIAIRFIKLATMQCLSPFFFACSASEKTERYLQSFLREYTASSAQILVAMIMYTVLIAMYNSIAVTWEVLGAALGLIMYLAGIIAVAGSGKFVRNLMA